MAALRRLMGALSVEVVYKPLGQPSVVLPPIGGVQSIIIATGLHKPTEDYVVRHEITHVVNHDADEPTFFHFEYPLPDAEMIADLVAFADLITSASCEQGEEWVARDIRGHVELSYAPWYRRLESGRIPLQLVQLRMLLDGQHPAII